MTEFEQQLLQHLQKQADQLTALSLSQSQTTAALLKISEQQAAIFRRAVEGTRGRVDEKRYGRAVEAVRGQFERVGGAFGKLLDVSEKLSERLPSPTSTSK